MKEKYSDISGIILSGGLSSRMGTDKTLLMINNQTLIERISVMMRSIFENILISTNDFEKYRFLGLPMVADVIKDHGPISGIHASIIGSKTDKNFILSCDLPLMSEEMIRYIVEFNSSKPISIPKTNEMIQPLCGVYNKSLITAIEKMINNSSILKKENGKSRASVKRLIESVDADIIEAESCPFYNENLFFNMNSIADYELFINKLTK